MNEERAKAIVGLANIVATKPEDRKHRRAAFYELLDQAFKGDRVAFRYAESMIKGMIDGRAGDAQLNEILKDLAAHKPGGAT